VRRRTRQGSRVEGTTSQESKIKPGLFKVVSTSGCDTGLNPSGARDGYELLCKWLKLRY
jgi:hypothetical protein